MKKSETHRQFIVALAINLVENNAAEKDAKNKHCYGQCEKQASAAKLKLASALARVRPSVWNFWLAIASHNVPSFCN